MKLLDKIEVVYKDRIKSVELYQGDLTELTENEFFDLLVVSAFPNDYIPTPSSLIGSLHRKGVSVAMLSKVKEVDLRSIYSCWLSIRLNPNDYNGIQFSRILCFEPLVKNQTPPELIGDIFQSLLPMTEQFNIKSIGMPILSTGDAMYPIGKILPILVEASVNWLNIGLGLDKIKIVAYSDQQTIEARRIFEQLKPQYEAKLNEFSSVFKYDYFISYSHANSKEASILYKAILRNNSNLQVFIDKKELNPGNAWQQELFESLDDCKYIYTMLSPEYLKSKVCLEEYHIAHFRQRESEDPILIPIYLYSTNLPTYMKLTQFIDCREGSREKIEGISLN